METSNQNLEHNSTTPQHKYTSWTSKVKDTPKQSVNRSLKCSSIYIEGDSHCRHLAGFIQCIVPSTTNVSGFCKPRAGVQVMTSTLPATSRDSYYVLIAGTNDVASGDFLTIYQHLEELVLIRTASATVIVSTLPHRHDLPANHPINQETEKVNFYIEELCARNPKLRILEFNSIGRQYFTPHGMHLTHEGKSLLAKLVVRIVKKKTVEDMTKPC